MKRIILVVLFFAFSLEQTFLKKSRHSKHGEDCMSDTACEEGLVCKINRCYTRYEAKNLKNLGLFEKNICDLKKKCSGNKVCRKHRCVDKDEPIETSQNLSEIADDVHLVFSGGIFLNEKPYLSGIYKNNTVNYDHLFKNVKRYIKAADLALVPQQTPFYIPEKTKIVKNYRNTPKELGDAIAKAGFNVILHATSNSYSKKEKGIKDTLNFWKTYPDIHPLGISSTEEEAEKDYYIFNKNNIKIGIINYSGFVGKNIPKKNKFMVNIMSIQKIKECAEKLREKVDLLVVCINWGNKYDLTPNQNQIYWAKTLISHGVDLIVGNHPSFVQPVSFVKSNNGKTGLVFFSLGDLVGENKKNIFGLGALANIIISKAKGKTYISSYSLIPTINHVSKTNYNVYRLSQYTDELGKEIYKKFNLEKVKKNCRLNLGAFAHCG